MMRPSENEVACTDEIGGVSASLKISWMNYNSFSCVSISLIALNLQFNSMYQ